MDPAQKVKERVCTAEESVAGLGLSFVHLPPLPPAALTVKQVTQGSWADESGIAPGSEIVELNGRAVRQMTEEDFKLAMKNRPLDVKVKPPDSDAWKQASKFQKECIRLSFQKVALQKALVDEHDRVRKEYEKDGERDEKRRLTVKEDKAETARKREELDSALSEMETKRAFLDGERVRMAEEQEELTKKKAELDRERKRVAQEQVELTKARKELEAERQRISEVRVQLTKARTELEMSRPAIEELLALRQSLKGVDSPAAKTAAQDSEQRAKSADPKTLQRQGSASLSRQGSATQPQRSSYMERRSLASRASTPRKNVAQASTPRTTPRTTPRSSTASTAQDGKPPDEQGQQPAEVDDEEFF
eukprot:TRINITY_DN98585_c0_g1_i1.p1 TRINITY_DN98585_c0_g1~~TRINITY_DN98585_c0_g1_i1.p1  ORF type:complete len:363 (+),score=102.29 TRINITY_DN98585_c0_g1_i1:79-1167(+)